jgi:hypothetical protein
MEHHEGTRLNSWISLVPQMIGVTLHNGERPVELLQQDDSRQFVRQRHFAQGERQRCRLPCLVSEAIRGADGEQQWKRIPVLIIAQKFGQLFRRKLLAPPVKQNQRVAGGSSVPRTQFEKRRFSSAYCGRPLERCQCKEA